MEQKRDFNEKIQKLAEENQVRKIFSILEKCENLEEAKEKIRALTEYSMDDTGEYENKIEEISFENLKEMEEIVENVKVETEKIKSILNDETNRKVHLLAEGYSQLLGKEYASTKVENKKKLLSGELRELAQEYFGLDVELNKVM